MVREAEVLALVAEGQTNRRIGQALFITPKTASVHISRILTKLGSPAAARQPQLPTGSTSTSHDPPASGCSTPAAGSATSDPGGDPMPFQVLTPPAAYLAVSNVSPRSNAL
jgi:hypothetical protein